MDTSGLWFFNSAPAAGASQPVGKGIDDNAETDPRDKP